jgi:hypothetical protein
MALNNDDIKQLIAILQKGLVDEPATEDKPIKPTTQQTKKSKPKDKKPQRENIFEDMPEMQMFKSDVSIDEKLRKFPPTPRTRAFKPVKVVCRVCGKKESISPSLFQESTDRYKCNKCSTVPGA